MLCFTLPRCFAFSLLSLVLGCCHWGCSNADSSGGSAQGTSPAKEVDSSAETSSEAPLKNILFFGNSLTAAYGLDPLEGFVALIQQKLEAGDLPYRTINSGLSGETTAGGASRVEWVLDQQKVDVFFLELGGNDGLRGIDPEASFQNLQSIIDKVEAKYPDCRIVLAGMEAPPNMGADYTTAFRQIYQRLADANKLVLMPFLLKDVGGIAKLNQPDGIHPTAEGNQIIAENVWQILNPIL
ncbi:MAG: arylesterase [Bacteroidota bacterium]